MHIYHGSDHIIEHPEYNGSKRTNDYGLGFYTTESLDLAKEWACGNGENGFANCYEFSMDGLRVLNLNSSDYHMLNWLAILTKYRGYWQKSSIAEEAKDYLQTNFFVDPEPYDVIIGYRADDSYFTFAQDFISGAISYAKLTEAMRLGKLGEQIVLKSQAAFDRIRYTGFEPATAEIWYDRKNKRDREARRAYRESKATQDTIHVLYMIDIMREGIQNDDPRLR